MMDGGHWPKVLCRTVCWFLCMPGVFLQGEQQKPVRARITSTQAEIRATALRREGYDVLAGSMRTGSFEVIGMLADVSGVLREGEKITILEESRPLREKQIQEGWQAEAAPGGYPDLAAILQEMDRIAGDFPEICQRVDLTARYGTAPTYEGRHLYAMKLSDRVAENEDEPAFLVVACHHAREIVTPVIALYALQQMTGLYGVDSVITRLIDESEVWIAPMWNPDGYLYMFDVNNMWRKNRRVFPSAVGVDLNRNYPFGWSSVCGGSTSPTSGLYKGPGPCSEAETITMMAWSRERRFAKVIDLHSYGREVVFEYSCSAPHPFRSYQQQEAQRLAGGCGYGTAVRRPTAEGEHYQWQVAEQGALANLLETHSAFQPPYTSALAEAEQVFSGIVMFLSQTIPVAGHVRDRNTGEAIVARIKLDEVHFLNDEMLTSGRRFGRYYGFWPMGDYLQEFSAEGYLFKEQSIFLGADDALEVEVELSWQPGDLDRDFDVDVVDLATFYGMWLAKGCGQSENQYCREADMTYDGRVDIADWAMLAGNWLWQGDYSE